MAAWVIMLIAVILYMISRWARNQPAFNVPVILSGAFAIGVIALLDNGKTQEIARGFAWLFVIVAAYQAIPAYTGAISSAGNAARTTAAAARAPRPNAV